MPSVLVTSVPYDEPSRFFIIKVTETGLKRLQSVHDMDYEEACDEGVEDAWYYVVHRLGLAWNYSDEASFEREREALPELDPPLDWSQYKEWVLEDDEIAEVGPPVEFFVLRRGEH